MPAVTLERNTYWRPVYWEPVEGSGERLMVGAMVSFDGRYSAHRTIRDDVLDCLYGKAADGVRALIDHAFEVYRAVGDIRQADFACLGMHPGELRHTWSDGEAGALRQAVLMYSSLSAPDSLDQGEAEDAPAQEEVNRRFASEIRRAVIASRPDLEAYFGRAAPLVEGGEPIRFGYASPRAIVHFGVLHPVRQPASVRDARARLWELHRAREVAGQPVAALMLAVPRDDDPTLSDRQRQAARRNTEEILREAESYRMRLWPVTSVAQGRDTLIEHA